MGDGRARGVTLPPARPRPRPSGRAAAGEQAGFPRLPHPANIWPRTSARAFVAGPGQPRTHLRRPRPPPICAPLRGRFPAPRPRPPGWFPRVGAGNRAAHLSGRRRPPGAGPRAQECLSGGCAPNKARGAGPLPTRPGPQTGPRLPWRRAEALYPPRTPTHLPLFPAPPHATPLRLQPHLSSSTRHRGPLRTPVSGPQTLSLARPSPGNALFSLLT